MSFAPVGHRKGLDSRLALQAPRWWMHSYGKVSQLMEAQYLRLDPDWCSCPNRRRARPAGERAHKQRGLFITPISDGTADLHGTMPLEQAAELRERLDQLATLGYSAGWGLVRLAPERLARRARTELDPPPLASARGRYPLIPFNHDAPSAGGQTVPENSGLTAPSRVLAVPFGESVGKVIATASDWTLRIHGCPLTKRDELGFADPREQRLSVPLGCAVGDERADRVCVSAPSGPV